MTTQSKNVTYHTDDYAVVGGRIEVTNWDRFDRRRVQINWPSIGQVDIATAKRFAADLQAAIEVAERFSERNVAAFRRLAVIMFGEERLAELDALPEPYTCAR